MVARLELVIDNKTVNYRNSSNLQGVIMENIDEDYASMLHEQKYNPYSQYISNNEGTNTWVINSLNNESYEHVIQKLLSDDFKEFKIKNNDEPIHIIEKKLNKKDKSTFLDEFYNVKGEKYYNIEFITPTSFKSNGRYMIFPDMNLIYKSLMRKYSAASDEMDMYDDDTLEQLVMGSEITRYRLQSTVFPLEGVSIPSYKGSMSVKIHGTDTMSRYARLLFRFGEYSGVGIKSSIGMGAIRIVE